MTQEDIRLEAIIEWIRENSLLINATSSVKILLHIKNTDVHGEVTTFPDSKVNNKF